LENEFLYHDIPTVNDQNVYRQFFLLQQIITPIQELQQKIINHETRSRMSFGLVLPIINRALEIANSMVLLLSRNRVRDASVLFLNLYELRLDLMFIALDPVRANIWIDCNTKNKKPWRVKDQQKAIFQFEGELNAEIKMYRNYSMIKHGNNAGGYSSFGFSMAGNGMMIDKMEIEMIIPQIINLSGQLASLAKTGIMVLKNSGICFEDLYEKIDKAYWEMRNMATEKIESVVYDWVFEKYPHLREIPDIKNKLRIEMTGGENDEGLKLKVILLQKDSTSM
jgi:hypothetical protein